MLTFGNFHVNSKVFTKNTNKETETYDFPQNFLCSCLYIFVNKELSLISFAFFLHCRSQKYYEKSSTFFSLLVILTTKLYHHVNQRLLVDNSFIILEFFENSNFADYLWMFPYSKVLSKFLLIKRNEKIGLRSATLLKKRLWHRCFPVNFVKFFKNTFSYRTPLVAASE